MVKPNNLENVYIAAPCNADWNDMHGGDTVRTCSMCSKNVYNISSMSKKEAEAFLSEFGVSRCMRLFRRFDGTIMTDDCPVGLRRLRNCIRFLTRTAATILGFLLSATFSSTNAARADNRCKQKGAITGPAVGTWIGGVGGGIGYGSNLTRKPPDIYYPKIDGLARASEVVVIAEYQGYENAAEIGFSEPPKANFRVIRTLKGSSLGSELSVPYQFQKTAEGTMPAGWTFSASVMPCAGTQFMLFLVRSADPNGAYETYQGSEGRIEVNDAVLYDQVLNAASRVEKNGGFRSTSPSTSLRAQK